MVAWVEEAEILVLVMSVAEAESSVFGVEWRDDVTIGDVFGFGTPRAGVKRGGYCLGRRLRLETNRNTWLLKNVKMRAAQACMEVLNDNHCNAQTQLEVQIPVSEATLALAGQFFQDSLHKIIC